MSAPAGNGAPDASGKGPVSGYCYQNPLCYYLLFMLLYVINMNTCTCSVSLTVVMLIYLCNSGIKICRKLPRKLTIQKPYLFNRLSVAGFAASIKPNSFDGSNYKRWRERVTLWLTAMNIMHVAQGKPAESTAEAGSAFDREDSLFRGAIISVLADNLVDTYITLASGKEMWDALEAKFGVSDAGSELYVMEQFLDYRMVEDRSVVEQAHEIHML
jgi:hypothetical protein